MYVLFSIFFGLVLRCFLCFFFFFFFFFQAEDGIRDIGVTGVQTCALPISYRHRWRYAKFYPRRRIDGPRQLSHLRQRRRSRRCWWLRRWLWPLPACLWRMRAFRIRPWVRSRQW